MVQHFVIYVAMICLFTCLVSRIQYHLEHILVLWRILLAIFSQIVDQLPEPFVHIARHESTHRIKLAN